MSKTVSILEDLGHRCDWRTCHSRHGILDELRKFRRKILGCARLLILTDSSQRLFSRFWGIFLEHSEDGPHTILNGCLRRIPITLTWNSCTNLLNLCLQHLIEAQLVLCSYCEADHLIPDDISERGLISVEILPHSTWLAVVKWETRFVPPSIEALIRMKTIVEITNEVDILGDRRAVDAHAAYFSALFTRYSDIDHFEMIEARILKLLHKKINLASEHVHPFKLVNLAGAGLSALLIQARLKAIFSISL
jgi:hypothetical protein